MPERAPDWEEKHGVVKAYKVGLSVYYVSNQAYGTREGNNGFTLQYWPHKRKETETVSILDSFDNEQSAIEGLEDKIEEMVGEKQTV